MDWNKVNEYRRKYKKDTENVAIFLRNEAAASNYKYGWLKAPEADGKQGQHVLGLRDFDPIAKHLAKQENFSVPADIMAALNRAIELRIKCNIMYETEGAKGTAANETNKRHQHVIRIFEGVRDILLPKLASRLTHESADMRKLSDMKERWAGGGRSSLFGVTIKFSFLSKGLKGMRQAIRRCWSISKAGVNDDAVISEVPSFQETS